MSSRELVVLGTSSQAPTRYRAHNSYVLRWDDKLILFDPGEGTQRQCLLAGTPIARLDAVCITHFHGDHSLGLAGVIQRRALDNRGSGGEGDAGPDPLPVCFPADGVEYFERLRTSTIFHDTSRLVPTPIVADGAVLEFADLQLSARALDHRVTTFGYRLDEPDRIGFDREALAARGIDGPDVGRLRAAGELATPAGLVRLEDVSHVVRGQSMAFVMDTARCEAALELARGVDLLVCESTFLESERDLAERYRHLTARQAAEIATEAGARRLVLTHFSARYPDNRVFASEAGQFHADVVAADDLATIEVPRR